MCVVCFLGGGGAVRKTVIIPCPVNPKYTNLILGIRLGLGLGLIRFSIRANPKTNLKPNPNPNPNLIPRIKFGVITREGKTQWQG